MDLLFYIIISISTAILSLIFLFNKADNGLRGMLVIFFAILSMTSFASAALFELGAETEIIRLARLIPLSISSVSFVIYYFYKKYIAQSK